MLRSVICIALFLVGVGRCLTSARAHTCRLLADPRQLVVALWLVAPPLAVITLKSTVYDAWRHLFFVYPALVIVAVSGCKALAGALASFPRRCRSLAGWVATGLILFDTAGVVYFMIRNHPYQNVYFNRLAGKDMALVKRRFELDYSR